MFGQPSFNFQPPTQQQNPTFDGRGRGRGRGRGGGRGGRGRGRGGPPTTTTELPTFQFTPPQPPQQKQKFQTKQPKQQFQFTPPQQQQTISFSPPQFNMNTPTPQKPGKKVEPKKQSFTPNEPTFSFTPPQQNAPSFSFQNPKIQKQKIETPSFSFDEPKQPKFKQKQVQPQQEFQQSDQQNYQPPQTYQGQQQNFQKQRKQKQLPQKQQQQEKPEHHDFQKPKFKGKEIIQQPQQQNTTKKKYEKPIKKQIYEEEEEEEIPKKKIQLKTKRETKHEVEKTKQEEPQKYKNPKFDKFQKYPPKKQEVIVMAKQDPETKTFKNPVWTNPALKAKEAQKNKPEVSKPVVQTISVVNEKDEEHEEEQEYEEKVDEEHEEDEEQEEDEDEEGDQGDDEEQSEEEAEEEENEAEAEEEEDEEEPIITSEIKTPAFDKRKANQNLENSLKKNQILRQTPKVNQDSTSYVNEESTGPIIGICPDMCPEKEIKDREYQKDLSVFEMAPNRKRGQPMIAVPELCIKKYTRSAAGEETPLPENVRPPKVLHKTLDHLITNILDRKDHPFPEIYNFVRDRCRAIVKDLTYQHIRDQDSVKLHEKIARFHILSYHILCDYPMEEFNPHQNFELLNKWLKSLKEMYHDLKQKGIECPNEAEFTSYFILSRLDSHESAKDLSSLSPELLSQPEIKFVIDVLTAYTTSNFYQFFKLLEKASYLNAILMHSFFTSMRQKAIEIMNRSFGTKLSNDFYEMDDFINLLAFEDEQEVFKFCTHFGIFTTDDKVYFKKSHMITPTSKLLAAHNTRIIERKTALKLSQIVNGKLIRKIPVSRDVSIVIPSTKEGIFSPKTILSPVTKTPLKSPTKIIRNNNFVQQETPQKPSEPILPPESPIAKKKDSNNFSFVQQDVPFGFDAKSLFIENKPPTPPMTKINISIDETPIKKVYDEKVYSVGNTPFTTINRNLNFQHPMDEIEVGIPIKEIVPYQPSTEKVDVIEIQHEESEEEILEVEPVLKKTEFITEIKETMARGYLQLWRKVVEKKKLKKQKRELFFKNLNPKELSKVMEPWQTNYNHIEELHDMVQNYNWKSHSPEYKRLIREPIDLPLHLYPILSKKNNRKDIYWKCVIMTGSIEEDSFTDIICSKFKTLSDSNILSQFSFNGREFKKEDYSKDQTLNVVITKLSEEPSFSTFKGASCLIYIIPPHDGDIDEQEFWHHQYQLYQSYVKTLYQAYASLPQIPLVILFQESKEENSLIMNNMISIIKKVEETFDKKLISSLHVEAILRYPDVEVFNNQISDCVRYLVEKSPKNPNINFFSFTDIFEGVFEDYFDSKVPRYNKEIILHQQDNIIIHPLNLQDFITHFNWVIHFASKEIHKQCFDIAKLNWPIPELLQDDEFYDYNQQEYYDNVNSILQKLSLPNFHNQEFTKKQLKNPTLDSLFQSQIDYLCDYLKSLKDYYGYDITSQLVLLSSQLMNILIPYFSGKGRRIPFDRIFEAIISFHFEMLAQGDFYLFLNGINVSDEFVETIVNEALKKKLPVIEPSNGISMIVEKTSSPPSSPKSDISDFSEVSSISEISFEPIEELNQNRSDKRKVDIESETPTKRIKQEFQNAIENDYLKIFWKRGNSFIQEGEEHQQMLQCNLLKDQSFHEVEQDEEIDATDYQTFLISQLNQ